MNIIGFAGGPRAGKDSSLKYIMGHKLVKQDIISRFQINENGDLLVNASYEDGEDMGVFDIDRKDRVYANYASEVVWPHVKNYHFASYLKMIAMNMYGLTYQQCYGSTEDKKSETKYTWAQFLYILPPDLHPEKKRKESSKVTAREFMQYLGDVLRHINDDCFTNVTMTQIENEQCPLSLIGDVRRVKEVERIKEAGGKVIFFTRSESQDSHRIENELKDADPALFDLIVDNQDLTMDQKNAIVYSKVQEWGYV